MRKQSALELENGMAASRLELKVGPGQLRRASAFKSCREKTLTTQKAFRYFVLLRFLAASPVRQALLCSKVAAKKRKRHKGIQVFVVFVFWRPAAVRSKVAARKRKRHKRQVAFFWWAAAAGR